MIKNRVATGNNALANTALNVANHVAELDDFLYGTPVAKEGEVDWTLKDPYKYVEDLKEERGAMKEMLGDMQCLLIEHGIDSKYKLKNYTLEQANIHVMHKFKFRDFTYAEKMSLLLRNWEPAKIPLNVPKARRQYNVLLAAIEDIDVAIVRFEAFAKMMNKKEGKEE